jgi:hypothetical protein
MQQQQQQQQHDLGHHLKPRWKFLNRMEHQPVTTTKFKGDLTSPPPPAAAATAPTAAVAAHSTAPTTSYNANSSLRNMKNILSFINNF